MRHDTILLRTAGAFSAILLTVAAPALAQETAPPKPLTINGSVGITTDYRLRGVSQSDNKPALQGTVTVTHSSGFYGGVFGSNLAGWGTFGGPNLEFDLIGGYAKTFHGTKVDAGLTWYMYPGGADKTDYAEPFVKVSHTYGPASALIGIAYAPSQEALGKWYDTGAAYAAATVNHPGAKHDNTYVWADLGIGIPTTKITAKGHLGHSWGNSGLGPNGTSVAPTGSYTDWLVGADYALYGPVTLSFAWVDTDISRRKAAYLQPSFSQVSNGASIAGSRFVFTATAAF